MLHGGKRIKNKMLHCGKRIKNMHTVFTAVSFVRNSQADYVKYLFLPVCRCHNVTISLAVLYVYFVGKMSDRRGLLRTRQVVNLNYDHY